MPKTEKVEKTRWTDAEKIQLLLSIIEHAGPVDWNKVKIPEGRTLPAARWQYQEYRRQYGGHSKTTRVANKSPTKSPDAKRKRASKARDDFINDDEEEDAVNTGEDEESPEKVTKRIKREPKNNPRYRESDSDSAEDNIDYLNASGGEEEV